jgi:hypothetical protein
MSAKKRSKLEEFPEAGKRTGLEVRFPWACGNFRGIVEGAGRKTLTPSVNPKGEIHRSPPATKMDVFASHGLTPEFRSPTN